MKNIRILILLAGIFHLAACGFVQESAKTVWGSSTRALKQARAQGIRENFSCSPQACFEAVTALTYSGDKPDAGEGKDFRLFKKDPARRYLVVMNVPGNVDTTEVGLFFDPIGRGQTQVEISSLSSVAVTAVGETVFPVLRKRFSATDGQRTDAGSDRDD